MVSKTNIIIFIFVVNALVAITSGFELPGGFHTGLWRAVITAVALPFLATKILKSPANIAIVVTLLYLSFSILTNTNIVSNIPTFVGVIFSLIMYPLAYTYFYSPEHYERLSHIIIILLFVLGVHFIWAQVFQVGTIPYESNGVSTYLGGGGVQQTFIMVYLLLFIPFIIIVYPQKFRWFELLAIILSIIPIFLIFRRGAIFGLMLGVLAYCFFTFRKGNVVKLVLAGTVVLIALFPLYLDRIEPMLERRTINPTDFEAVEAIGRTQEIIVWSPYWMEQKGTMHILFGSELYDYQELAGGTRSLHSDYATYLVGAGVIGFALYFSVIGFIWFDFYRSAKKIKSKVRRRELLAVMASLTIAYMVISYSGQYYVISALSTIMLLFGVMNRYTKELSKKDVENNGSSVYNQLGS